MKKLLILLLELFVITYAQAKDYDNDIPFRMPQVKQPVIPNHQVKLTDFGAVGDGKTLCTDAFTKAFEALAAKGGGKLVIPQGVWYTGPISLRSHIELHLEAGSIIMFSDDLSLYPIITTTYEGGTSKKCKSPISAFKQTDIAITGYGLIDGSGDSWRPLKRAKVTDGQWKKMTSKSGTFVNESLWEPTDNRSSMRPVMVNLVECKNILVKDVVIQNPPAWNLHPLMCEDITIDHATLRSPAYGQNGDALDLESCRNALVINSTFDAGDDCICLKSGKNEEGRKRAMPTENIIVRGCTVYNGHGGFVVGSEMSGGVRNVLVENCQFVGTGNGLRFKSCRGRGGIVENIYIRGISMANIEDAAITFDMYYGKRDPNEVVPPVDESTPIFRKIEISNVSCRGAKEGLHFRGLPEMPIQDVRLNSINIIANSNPPFEFCKNVVVEPCYFQTQESEKPRVLISTDIGGTDPDDNQSITHLLMYSNEFDLEGLVSSPSFGDGHKGEILRMIDVYEKDFPILSQHIDGLMKPEGLRPLVKQGRMSEAPACGYGEPTEGSDWIIRQARKNDSRPLYVLVWGCLEDVAQALHDAPDIAHKLRIHWIGGPNKKWGVNAYMYIVENFPDLWMIENNTTYRGFIYDSKNPDEWNAGYFEHHIKNAGNLGRDFAAYYKGNPKLGDTPSLLYMMQGNPENPKAQSWGGKFVPTTHTPRTIFHGATTAKDTVQICGIIEWQLKGPKRKDITIDSVCVTLDIRNQKWKGYYKGNGLYVLRHSTYYTGTLDYTITSTVKGFKPITGQITVENTWNVPQKDTDLKVGAQWWTDSYGPEDYWNKCAGANYQYKVREEIMRDWAKRWEWLKEKNNK